LQRAAAMALGLAALSISLGSSGCSTPVEQPYPGECEPLRVLEWTPRGNSLDVPRDTPVSIRLTDYPDPDTIGTSGFILTTGPFYHPGTYVTDLVDKTITVFPAGELRASLGYHMTVRTALRSLSGCAAVEDGRTFRTSATTALPPRTPPVAVPVAAEVLPIFARSCAGAACHRAETSDAGADPGGGCLERPAALLSLCDRDAVASLVGVPSDEVPRLRLVEKNDSPRSYLLRKLLPGATAGHPAPPALGDLHPPGAPLSRDELHAIARWIDTGANP
jgi:hypothetical protein